MRSGFAVLLHFQWFKAKALSSKAFGRFVSLADAQIYYLISFVKSVGWTRFGQEMWRRLGKRLKIQSQDSKNRRFSVLNKALKTTRCFHSRKHGVDTLLEKAVFHCMSGIDSAFSGFLFNLVALKKRVFLHGKKEGFAKNCLFSDSKNGRQLRCLSDR